MDELDYWEWLAYHYHELADVEHYQGAVAEVRRIKNPDRIYCVCGRDVGYRSNGFLITDDKCADCGGTFLDSF